MLLAHILVRSLFIAALPLAVACARPPNLLLITADDLGNHLGFQGYAGNHTPQLDALASRSGFFNRAWVTQASCSPSRSSLLTGLYPHQNGQIGLTNGGYSMQPGVPTLPNLLSAAGYRTGLLGKLHVFPEAAFHWDFRDSTQAMTFRVETVRDLARNFFEADTAKPFFLMVNFLDPHTPYKTQIEGHPAQTIEPGQVPPFPFILTDYEQRDRDIAGYVNGLRRLDEGVGLLLEALRASGHADDTVIIFLSDNGPDFPRAKTTCSEAGLRVPLLLYAPGMKPFTSDALVSGVDVFATLLKLAGVPAPAGVTARPLPPYEIAPPREYLFGEYTSHSRLHFFPGRTVRDGRYHYVLNLKPGLRPLKPGEHHELAINSARALTASPIARLAYATFSSPPAEELYDTSADPEETTNLIASPAHAFIAEKLRAALAEWRRATNDPLLDPAALAALAASHAVVAPKK